MICLQNKPGRASGPQAGRSITEDFYGIAFNHFEYIFSPFFFFFYHTNTGKKTKQKKL